jgi:proteasome accessory factor C
VTTRDVDPRRLLLGEGQGYLEGWCHLAEDWRLFRLDRVQSVQVLPTPVGEHPPPEDRASAFDTEAAPWQVRLALEPRASWLLEAYAAEVVSREPELVVELPVGDLGWARQLLLQLGGSARPLAPPELVADVRAEATAALAGYDLA